MSTLRDKTPNESLAFFFSHNYTDEQVSQTYIDSGPSPNLSPAGRGVVCEVTPVGLLTYFVKFFFSHRTHRFNRALLRTVSNSQNASGIQISQNVIAKGGCWVLVVRC